MKEMQGGWSLSPLVSELLGSQDYHVVQDVCLEFLDKYDL